MTTVWSDQAVQRSGAQPLAAVSVGGGLRAGRFEFAGAIVNALDLLPLPARLLVRSGCFLVAGVLITIS